MLRLLRTDAGRKILHSVSIKRFSSSRDEYTDTDTDTEAETETRIHTQQKSLATDKEPETNYVKLIGKAWDNSKMLNDGSLSCKVVQRCINDVGTPFSISHMVTIPKKVQKSNGLNLLMRNQRFNINGYIRSIPFVTSKRKTRRAVSIVPHDIELYKVDGDGPIEDVCIVMMTAQIESRIHNESKWMAFTLKTHTPSRDSDGKFTGEAKEHFHTVVVKNSEVRRYVKDHLKQSDRAFVEGYLQYNPTDTPEGIRMQGNIVAIHIEKI